MSTLLIAEHDNTNIADATLKAASAAAALGGDVSLLIAGENCGEAAEAGAKIAGVSKVLRADNAAYGKMLAEPLADLVVSLAGDYENIVSAATTNGKNYMPRIAALLDASQISDITAIIDGATFERPIYAGNAIQTVKSNDSKVITVRGTAFPAAELTGAASIEDIADAGDKGISEYVGEELTVSDRPELTSAKIIVSGGRGMGSGENFDILEKVADKLGAGIGASRAAVDAGYVPNDYQVGQTGKVVAPELYIAVGISGAIQHLAGMKDSKSLLPLTKMKKRQFFRLLIMVWWLICSPPCQSWKPSWKKQAYKRFQRFIKTPPLGGVFFAHMLVAIRSLIACVSHSASPKSLPISRPCISTNRVVGKPKAPIWRAVTLLGSCKKNQILDAQILQK